MHTVPQAPTTDNHAVAFDAALRDARLQLPRSADARRADAGLVLALNGHVTLHSTTEAHVRSAHGLRPRATPCCPWSCVLCPLQGTQDEGHRTKDTTSEVVYHMTRWGCDCPDSVRRRTQRTDDDTPLGLYFCTHQYAAALVGLAHLTLWAKHYVPEVDEVWFSAVATGQEFYGVGGEATETEPGLWFFRFHTQHGGFYTDVTGLELWDKTPVHVRDWRLTCTAWSRWLHGR